MAGLTDELAVLERVYATEGFRQNRPPFTIATGGLEDVIARSDYLRALVTTKHEAPPDARALFTRGFALAQRGDPARAREGADDDGGGLAVRRRVEDGEVVARVDVGRAARRLPEGEADS